MNTCADGDCAPVAERCRVGRAGVTPLPERGEPAFMTTDESGIPAEGDVITHERTITTEDVREFGAITGDRQSIHTDPDGEGRLIVQGLLTGSLMTKIGGDLSYIARTMEYEFLKPVYTGVSITCEWTVESRTEREDRYLFDNSVTCRDEGGSVVLEAHTSGLIRKDDG